MKRPSGVLHFQNLGPGHEALPPFGRRAGVVANQIAREKNRGDESMPAQNRESAAVVAKVAVVERDYERPCRHRRTAAMVIQKLAEVNGRETLIGQPLHLIGKKPRRHTKTPPLPVRFGVDAMIQQDRNAVTGIFMRWLHKRRSSGIEMTLNQLTGIVSAFSFSGKV